MKTRNGYTRNSHDCGETSNLFTLEIHFKKFPWNNFLKVYLKKKTKNPSRRRKNIEIRIKKKK